MQMFKARFYENDQLLFDEIEVQVEIIEHDPGWFGQLEYAQGEFVPFQMGGAYRIELDNGQSGDIKFSGLKFGSDCTTTAKFQGTSPLTQLVR